MIQSNNVHNIYNLILKSVIDSNFKGFDPYDYRGHEFVYRLDCMRSNISITDRFVRRLIHESFDIFPNFCRSILNVKELGNPKGDALILSSLFRVLHNNNSDRTDLIHTLANKLLSQNLLIGEYFALGYPFNWSSYIPIKANTPNVICTVFAGFALYDYWNEYNDEKSLSALNGIYNFIIDKLLKKSRFSGNRYFSYTPLDDFEVNNANLLALAYLAMYNIKILKKNDFEFIDILQNILIQIDEYGYLPYANTGMRNKYNMPLSHDHYHTGFEIRSLFVIDDLYPNLITKEAFFKFINFYLNQLYDDTGFLKYNSSNKFPVHSHSLNESILTLLAISKRTSNDVNLKINKTIQTLETHFVDRINGKVWFKIDNNLVNPIKKINYYRWNQAWTLRSYAELLNNNKRITLPI